MFKERVTSLLIVAMIGFMAWGLWAMKMGAA